MAFCKTSYTLVEKKWQVVYSVIFGSNALKIYATSDVDMKLFSKKIPKRTEHIVLFADSY